MERNPVVFILLKLASAPTAMDKKEIRMEYERNAQKNIHYDGFDLERLRKEGLSKNGQS